MTMLEKSQVAKEYYAKCISRNAVSGFERYVATDGENSMFVNSDYEPETQDICVYKMRYLDNNTLCELYKPKAKK